MKRLKADVMAVKVGKASAQGPSGKTAAANFAALVPEKQLLI